AVMLEMERLMRPLDARAAGEPGDPDFLREAAGTISTFLLTVPHLFPPTTNLQDPNAEIPTTLARSEIWEDFASFHGLAEAAAAAAADALTASADELPQAAARLRAAWDARHTAVMRTYSPPTVTEEDLEFDFASLFPADWRSVAATGRVGARRSVRPRGFAAGSLTGGRVPAPNADRMT